MGLSDFLESVPEEGGQFTYACLSELSGISNEDAEALAREWRAWDEKRMANFLVRLGGLAEDDALLEFMVVFKQALNSQHAIGRKLAIAGLAECDERWMISRLIEFMRADESASVRSEAASAIARFTAMAAEGKFLMRDRDRLNEVLLTVLNAPGEVDEVRRRALEAAAVFGGEEIATRIAAAYQSGDPEEVRCALYSMGRTSDSRWLPEVLEQLKSPDPSSRFEAARSLGEIGEESHVLNLADTLEDDDPIVAAAAAASLSRLGGAAARKLLRQATESDHNEVAEAANNALRFMDLENILFEDEPGVFGIAPQEAIGDDHDPDDDLADDPDDDGDDWPHADENIDFDDEFGLEGDDGIPLLIGEFDDDDDDDELDDEDID